MKYISVDESLKAVRKKYNLRQREIAEALGIDRSTYSFYETGKTNPPLNVVFGLAKIYKVNIGYILGRESQNPEIKPYEGVAAGVDPIAYLSKEEQQLLMYYRLADEEKKAEMLAFLKENN